MTTPGSFYDHFSDGVASGRPGEPSSLELDAQRWNQTAEYRPDSVLSQVMLAPGNGRSDRDAERVLPGGQAVLSTNNGSSDQTQTQLLPEKMAGYRAL